MTHITSGVRKILELPGIYNFWQLLLGGQRHHRRHFRKYFDLKQGQRVLDLGCGTANLLHYLDPAVEYFGVDIEEKYIRWNLKHYSDRGAFYQENVIAEERENWYDYFDAINAHGLLHHLTDFESKTLLERSYRYLKPSGYLVTVDSVFHENQGFVSRWLVGKDRGQNIRTPVGYLNLAQERFEKVDHYILDNHINIPYSVFVMVLTKC